MAINGKWRTRLAEKIAKGSILGRKRLDLLPSVTISNAVYQISYPISWEVLVPEITEMGDFPKGIRQTIFFSWGNECFSFLSLTVALKISCNTSS